MPNPILVSTPINLKTSGTSVFWIQASNVAAANTIKIVKNNFSAGFWEGTLDSSPGNNKGWKVKVTYNSKLPILPPGKRRGKKDYSAGDLVDVTITVTNGAGGSGTLPDSAIVDG